MERELHKKLNLSVRPQRMENWIESTDDLLFPKANDDLENIINLKRALHPDKEVFDLEVAKLKKGSISLLYEVKQKLDYQICNNEQESLLSKLDENDLKKLLSKKEIKQIQSIEKL